MKKTYIQSVLAALFLSVSFTAWSQNISTFAGDGTYGNSGDGGPATAAELGSAAGVAADPAGNVYIADFGESRIKIVNTSGIINTFAGNGTSGFSGDGGPATAAELDIAFGVTIDASGNIYIADLDNYRVRLVNTSGIISTIAGNGVAGSSGDGGPATAAELHYPTGTAVDAAGNVYIADQGGSRVRMVNTSGNIITFAGIATPGFSGDGGPATAAEIYSPSDVKLDASGNLYIADTYNNRIRMVNTSGIISTVAGTGTAGSSGDGGPATAAEFDQPYDVSFDPLGNLYIADLQNSKIRMINTSGIISTFAGLGTAGFSGDGGLATAAELQYPSGVTADAHGNIFIGDENNYRVRKVTSVNTGIPGIFTSEEITIYPVPTSGVFTISGIKPGQTIELYDYTGQLLSSTIADNPTMNFDISTYSNGIYLVRIISNNGAIITTKKILKSK